MVNPKRIKQLNSKAIGKGPIIYWMGRDQRINDNWSLLYAQELAKTINQPLVVVFAMPPTFENAGLRQYEFAISGLEEIEKGLQKKNIPFFVPLGDVAELVIEFAKTHKAAAVVTDQNPMHYVRATQQAVADSLEVPLFVVDAHNIIPVWVASDKLEFAAYTIRPKIHRLLPEFLENFPELQKQAMNWTGEAPAINWQEVRASIKADSKVTAVDWIKPGEKAAHKMLENFFVERLQVYATDRNDPNKQAQSNLSPYLHFGHIAAGRVALEASSLPESEAKDSFLEELIVRKELADNFCYYNPNYDNFNGFHAWAQKTLNEHREDERQYLYTRRELEDAQTHDELWNAAQLEMTTTGKMHNYMRMYWAKKILEWTPDPETALSEAIYLNDKYELDGRDPNGYVGCAWSIGGVHDRAWGEREIFGKIRFMSYNGAKSKFKIQNYIDSINALSKRGLF